jgi:hypothetical protein
VYPNLKLNAENVPLKLLALICLSAHNASAEVAILLIKALEQRLALYM